MKRILLTAVTFALFLVVNGQEMSPLIPEVIPPGPTAAELGRYGIVPVNMHTGNTNISIPLYEFTTKNLSVPISLSYNSSAIQVDEVASWVGMHWSLNAGGVITRIVRDQTDRPSPIPYPEDFSMQDGMSYNYVLYNGPIPDALDTEPDLFVYNFQGLTGKFVIDREGMPVAMPRNDLIIKRLSQNGEFVSGFIVTTPDGVKYTFDEVEVTSTTGSGTNTETYNVSTAWYLTQIRHPMGDVIELTYEPDNYSYPLSISVTAVRNISAIQCPSGEQTCPGGSDGSTITHMSMRGKRLSSIDALGHGFISFEATTGRSDMDGGSKLSGIEVKNAFGSTIRSFGFDYDFSDNNTYRNPLALAYMEQLVQRMFLTRVVERDKLTNEIKEHTFEYDNIDGLPARLSMARDHWGYFNGKNNSSLLPKVNAVNHLGQLAFPQYDANREPNGVYAKKGLLTKITYPTGGSSEFFYEANTYWGTHTVYPNKNHTYLEVEGIEEQWDDISSSKTIFSGVDQIVQVSVSCNYKSGYSSTYGHGKWIVYDDQGRSIYVHEIKAGSTKTEHIRLSAGKQYIIELIAEGPPPDGMWANNTISNLSFQHYATSAQNVTENIETGGVRIASVTNHDPVNGEDEVMRYHYARHDQLFKSSGKMMSSAPDYVTRFGMEKACSRNPDAPLVCDVVSCSYIALHSSGMNTLFRQDGNHINYEYVTISRGTELEGGLEEHEFIVSGDRQGTLVWGNNDIPGTPLSNTGWNNGLEKAVRYYRLEGSTPVLLRSVENEYTKDASYHKEIPGLSFRTNYWSECYSMQVAAEIRCNQSNVDLNGHPCNGHSIGEIIYIPTGIINMVDAVEYMNISHWFYLSKQIVTTYDENGFNPIVQETRYFYDNKNHTQLSREVTTSSTGITLESKYKYAKDYEHVSGGAVKLMADDSWNMVGVLIERIQKVGDQVTLGSASGFEIFKIYEDGILTNEFIAPKSIYRYNTYDTGVGFSESTDGSTFLSYKKRATIHRYDNKGNILEVSKEGDFRTSYIWGYEGKYPVAKLENVTYSSIPLSIKNDIKAKSNQDYDRCQGISGCDEANLRKSLNSLRNISELSEALITTYTYDPAVGVTSETDPNGKTVYYEYDNFGRLSHILDFDGNIIQTFEYNYRD